MSETHPDLARAETLSAKLKEARRDQHRAERWSRLFSRLSPLRTASAARLACLLRELYDTRIYELLGFSSVTDYARVELDLEPRQTRDLVRLGKRLPDLPHVDRALAEGTLGWTKVRELIRIVTPETERAWLERAQQLTSRELEADVARVVFGEGPPEGKPDDPRGSSRRRIVLEMEATDAECLFQALALLRAQTGAGGNEIENGAALAVIARRFLEDANETDDAPTSEPYRVVLEHCPSCAHTTGIEAEVTETIASEAACDAQIIDMTPGPQRGHMTRSIPPAVRRAVLHRDRWACAIPHCHCKLWLHVHHLDPWAKGGGHDVENLAVVCSVHHRLIHEGLLAVARLSDGNIVVEDASGRRSVSTPRVG